MGLPTRCDSRPPHCLSLRRPLLGEAKLPARSHPASSASTSPTELKLDWSWGTVVERALGWAYWSSTPLFESDFLLPVDEGSVRHSAALETGLLEAARRLFSPVGGCWKTGHGLKLALETSLGLGTPAIEPLRLLHKSIEAGKWGVSTQTGSFPAPIEACSPPFDLVSGWHFPVRGIGWRERGPELLPGSSHCA